jgi:hypothetical protein
MQLGSERRNGNRRKIELPVTRQTLDRDLNSWTYDVSPTGVKLRKLGLPSSEESICNIEVHLVPGAITTVIAARRVWQNDSFEAFEFISPSYAQQMIMEKMAGNL